MRKTAIIPLILGLVIGLFTVKLAVDTIRKAQAANPSASMIKIVQTREDIGAQELISAEMVTLVETADTNLVPQHERIESLEDVVGRVSGKAIPAGVPFLTSMLAPEGTPAGLMGRIKPGYRAVSVKIDEVTAVAYQIKPGDWVDVIVVMDVDTGRRGRKQTIAKVVLEHVQVASIGHDMKAQASSSGSAKVKPAKSATLLVREENVAKLHLVATRGKLTLAMRGQDDLPTAGKMAMASFDEVMNGFRPNQNVTGSGESFFDRMFGSKGKPASTPVASSGNQEGSRSVMVVHGWAGGDSGRAWVIDRYTFESSNSPVVIDSRVGMPIGVDSTLGSGKASTAGSGGTEKP